MASQTAGECKARLHYVKSSDDEPPGPPQSDDAVHSFVQNGGYRCGDVINFSRERFAFAWMVTYDGTNHRFGLIRNPDESGSGYLTLPEEVLEASSGGDAIGKYRAVMGKTGSASVIFHLPSHDKLIQDKLGSELLEGWKFKAEYVGGQMESFLACPAGCNDFRQFNYSTLTWRSLQEAFSSSAEEQTSLSVTVRLKRDKLAEYKRRYGVESDKHAWLKAMPSLPASWTLTKAGGSASSNHHTMKWLLKGPQTEKEQVKEELHNFLGGFDFDVDGK